MNLKPNSLMNFLNGNNMTIDNKEYFVLICKKTRKKLLCSWFPNQPDYFGQKVHYIGVTDGLGGYHNILKNGYYDRRDFKN